MNDFRPAKLRERNPLTHARHRREVFWQITLPLLLGLVLFVGVSVLSALGNSGEVSRGADVALIWLILPLLVVGLIFLVVLAGLTYGLVFLIRGIPGYARQAQDLVALVADKTRQLGDAAVEPIYRLESFMAGVRAAQRGVRRGLRGK